MTDTLMVLLGSFLLLMLLGLPVAWSLLTSMLAWVAYGGQWRFLPIAAERIWQGMDVFVLMAIPLFILAGELVNAGKITDRLIHFANVLFGWMRGGLAQVNIGASILFSGITGVALGDIAALGRVFIPAMVKQGYSPAYAAAVTASSSIIGPMVPPSLVAVIYGSMTGLSIGALMAATLIPGLLIGLVQMLLVAVQARRHNFPQVEMDRSPAVAVRATGQALVPLMIPVIILAGLMGGLMTPTEAGAVAAGYALVVATLVYRSLRLGTLGEVFQRSALFSGQLLIIVGCGAAFSWVMGMENVPRMVAGWIGGWEMGYLGTLLVFNAILLVLGMFIDPTTVIILFGPILSAAAVHAGIDPLHFGVIAILNLNIGLLTPPLGVCLFAAERIAGCGLGTLIKANTPFLLVNLAGLGLIAAVPGFSLWLPAALGF
ncbi:TRAP transporter large permease [Pararhodobacter aggregans]|uniref:TRAP transporter large permease protein n=1 Tax=Pararhodobacter aggregans TaxID=404875 RepID=A0A2T7UWJ6_9RHOB|nr:TRAP transporter large permease [Pararhodobacter aggregans]PTX04797.1 tripartite ATP-independent transporter DctM subunit [Pararhodobacter aggregans]PVE49127.1 C4-dicarboxylate ABC transporter permease [Pararhodobacter aggregans]